MQNKCSCKVHGMDMNVGKIRVACSSEREQQKAVPSPEIYASVNAAPGYIHEPVCQENAKKYNGERARERIQWKHRFQSITTRKQLQLSH
eukprot:747813-Hanusia_phi.AAC.3